MEETVTVLPGAVAPEGAGEDGELAEQRKPYHPHNE
jgi:hypothetical protein